jgi:hypothetical protein
MQKPNSISTATILRAIFCVPFLLVSIYAGAQMCSDPVNVIYGVTNTGAIHPINVNTGVADPQINPAYPGNAPDQSNGLAYNPVSGKFYYFKRNPSSTITEFVSFDPATNIYTILSNPSTSNSVFSGSLTNDGTGYYCWDTQGTLFYYSIASNTWTTITSNIKDQYGKDVDSIIRLHYSGDGAIDGYGNLWLMPSSATKYGLFRLDLPLPTTTVASITVEEVIPMTPSATTFVGIAFNNTGQIFMSTSSSNLYRLEDNLSLTLMSSLSIPMADLTSCNFPFSVLAGTDYNFTASIANGNVALAWKPSVQLASATYTIERSTDNRNWHTIATAADLHFSINKISFTDVAPLYGRNFYRIKIVDAGNRNSYSVVRTVELKKDDNFFVWPNPVVNYVYIRNKGENAMAIVYSETGSRIRSAIITSGLNNIDLKTLPAGKYVITIYSLNSSASFKIVKK